MLRKKQRVSLPDILEVRDIFRRWIQSCTNEAQLCNLQHAVQDLITERYAHMGESPYVIVHVSSYLHSLIRIKTNLVTQKVAMV